MNTSYYKEYSYNLNRDMEFKTYGWGRRVMLVFPCQNGRFFDYEDHGMIEVAAPYIDSGRIQVVCVDSVDAESWSPMDRDPRQRIETQEAYFHYITDEMVPRIHELCHTNDIFTTGNSMGATHALNFLLRRPDLFSGCIALSGAYNARLFFPDYMDDLVYANSPVDYIEGMPYDHPYVEMYRHRDIIICCGRGAWEYPMQDDAERMKELFAYKNIPAWVDFWGTDVCHDWPWWRRQLPYYLNYMC